MNHESKASLARDFRAAGLPYREIALLLGTNLPAVRKWLCDPQQAAYLQPDDVARLLAVSPKKVRAFIQSGELRASNVSNSARPRFIVRREDFDAFLESRAVNVAPPVKRRFKIVRRPEDRY